MKKNYPISYWYGIRPAYLSKERLEEAKEAGFNIIECAYDPETNKKVLGWCEELGIKANVGDYRITDIALAGQEGWEAAVLEAIADYANYPAVNRFFLRDEPVDDYFPTLGRVAEFLHKHDPKHGEYINLLPCHAVPTAEGESFNTRYQRHIDGFCEAVHPTILSYDHYNLKMQAVDSLEGRIPARVSPENVARNGWENVLYAEYTEEYYYDNLELIRKNALERNLPWMDIILLSEHWHYRWPTEAEIRWEAFTALAYGANALSYFTYWTPDASHNEPWSYHNGIILTDGTRGEKYEIVKTINTELQVLYAALCQDDPMTSEAVYHVGEEIDELAIPFAGHGRLTAIDGDRLVVGCFANNLFMLVNKDFRNPSDISCTADGHIQILNKATGAWEDTASTVTLAAGDGELLRIV